MDRRRRCRGAVRDRRGGLTVAIYAAWLFHDMPDAGELVDYRPPTATRAYAWDGTLIGEFSRETPDLRPLRQIPAAAGPGLPGRRGPQLLHSTAASMSGACRAPWSRTSLNAGAGPAPGGGSTITQQVAKNVLLTSDPTIGRKLKEAILAHRLEQTLYKRADLRALSERDLAGLPLLYGVGAAAYNYFGKSLPEPTLDEMRLPGGPAEGPEQLPPSDPRQGQRPRPPQLGDGPDGRTGLGQPGRGQRDAMTQDPEHPAAPPSAPAYRDADYFVEEVRQRGVATLGPRLERRRLLHAHHPG